MSAGEHGLKRVHRRLSFTIAPEFVVKIFRMTRFYILPLFLLIVWPQAVPGQVNVRLVTDEAEAVLVLSNITKS
jgi:hypothetical protein